MEQAKQDYRGLYEQIVKSEWFKKAYHNKSLGERPIVVDELEESEDERIRKALYKMAKVPRKEIYEAEGITKEQALAWLEKQKEKKPAEWSEEDEKMLNHVITTLAQNVARGSAREDFEFLGSLPKRFSIQQPKLEWGEEDKRAINRAVVALRAYANGELPEILPSEILECADRLQSLRPQPHWKPSEEQMEALKEDIDFAPDTYKLRCTLMSLYNDLKKLM